ncbi:hypothetical protein ACFVGM_05480 [Kitasatospora purpeofusca]|uniref:hypothetical protein n=1 Tax=Kitasatospora purpeofusca TaxID=67352 RepID=UPI0036CFDE0B
MTTTTAVQELRPPEARYAEELADARFERAETHAERWSDHAPVTVAYDPKV